MCLRENRIDIYIFEVFSKIKTHHKDLVQV